MHNTKIKTQEQAIEIAQRHRREGNYNITTNGSFDLIHPPHIRLLERAKQYGDYLFVLLNSDDSIKRFKGDKRPINSQDDRAYVIASLETVDYVVIFEQDTPLKLLEQLQPHYHVKGGSWIEERIKAEKDLLATWGGQFVGLPLEEGYSSTNIIEKILDAYKE